MKNETLHHDTVPTSKDLLFASDILRDIGMGEWKLGDEVLISGAASTCIILAAHNSETGRGLIGHFSSISDEEGDVYGPLDGEAFDEATAKISEIGPLSSTSVWVGGGSPCVEDGIDTVESDRQYAKNKVQELVASRGLLADNVTIEWSDTEHVIDVELDCPTGILVVHDYTT